MQDLIGGTIDTDKVFSLEESDIYCSVYVRLLNNSMRVWAVEGDLRITFVSGETLIAEIIRRSKITINELEQKKLKVVRTELQKSCFDYLLNR